MCCGCCESDNINKLELPTKDGQVDFRDNHGCCRDLYCLIVLIAAVIGMIVVFAVGFSTGEPAKLYSPIDKFGGFCGLDTDDPRDKKDYDKIVYYNISAITDGICVKECPTRDKYCVLNTGDIISLNMSDCLKNSSSEYYIGADSLDDLNITTDLLEEALKAIENMSLENAKKLLFEDLGLNLNYVITDSVELMNRCVPNIKEIVENLEQFNGLNNVFTAAVSDVKNSWGLFLATVGITLVICFVVIFCLQCFAKCITWCLVFLGVLLVIVIGVIALVYGGSHYKNDLQSDKTSSKVFIGFGVGCLVAALILIIILFALRKRISLAAALVQVASDAIKGNLCLILVPVVYSLIFVVGFVLILITMVYYFSSLKVETVGLTRSIEINKNDRFIVLFVVLCFWWFVFFVIGANQYTIAGAGAYHYFSRKGEKPFFPIARTLVTLVLHHLGSIAMGSFLIALVATVRTILLYAAKKAKAAKSEQLKCLISCLQCCLGCLQKCVEFIASRAYIMMAIQGKNFWVSAFDALTLLMGNPLRTLLLTAISKLLIIMAELTVAGVSLLIAFILLRPDLFGSDWRPFPVMYWWFIAFICALIAFFLTWIIFQVYESLIDTIFFCFLYDEKMEENHRENYTTYCPKDLMQYMTVVDTNAREDDGDPCCCCCAEGSDSGGRSGGNDGSSSSSGESVKGSVDV